ncbi:MAG: YitT family protein [Clostridia bacterium]|nr:YitT family protein [Clostridia bacterium]
MKKLSILKNEQVLAYTQIVFGCVLGAAAYPLFLTPNHISPGGLTGIAMVFNYLFGAPVGTTSLLMNVPLFIIGFRAMGRVFVFRSLIAALLFSLLIDIIPLPVATMNPLLGAVFGGVILGVGLGLILRGGATTGGTDMAARMLHKKFQHISVGTILFAIDCVSVLMAGISIEVEYALYALICIYISDKVVDMVMTGVTHEKACYIISNHYEAIKQEIMIKLERGVTVLHAEGGWSGQQRPVLLCVLSAQEVGRVKAIVRTADETAFVFISDAHEVLGEGFRKLAE